MEWAQGVPDRGNSRSGAIAAVCFAAQLGRRRLEAGRALGAFAGRELLINLLLGSVLVAGVMALVLVIYKGRVRQTVLNIGHILVSLVTFRLPGSRVSLDNPDSLKVPYGLALAFTVVLYGVAHVWGVA